MVPTTAGITGGTGEATAGHPHRERLADGECRICKSDGHTAYQGSLQEARHGAANRADGAARPDNGDATGDGVAHHPLPGCFSGDVRSARHTRPQARAAVYFPSYNSVQCACSSLAAARSSGSVRRSSAVSDIAVETFSNC